MLRRAGAFGALTLVALGTGAGASSPSGWVVKVSGALSGTLRAIPSDCGGTDAKGGQVEFIGHLKGYKSDAWTITFLDPHSGKWTGHSVGVSSFVLQPSGLAAWVASSGSFTTKGTDGSANLELVPESITPKAHGKVHVSATWSCPPAP